MTDGTWYNAREFSEHAQGVLTAAGRLVEGDVGHGVGARHVACVLFCDHPVGQRLAESADADLASLQTELRQRAAAASDSSDDADLLLRCTRAQRPSFGPKGIEDLVLAVFEPPFGLEPVFARHGLTLGALRAALPDMRTAAGAWGHVLEEQRPAQEKEAVDSHKKERDTLPVAPGHGNAVPATRDGPPRNPGIAASRLARQLPSGKKEGFERVLAAYGTDLVEEARAGRLDPVIGREAEVSRVLQILARRTKNNVCLIGAPGVGKTAVAEAVAQRIATGRVPSQLVGCRELWSLDFGALLAGTGLRGDFEERLRTVLEELRSLRGEALLFIDELHLALGAGRSESNNVDAANLMKPMLARGELHCIGATTTGEYLRLIIAKDVGRPLMGVTALMGGEGRGPKGTLSGPFWGV